MHYIRSNPFTCSKYCGNLQVDNHSHLLLGQFQVGNLSEIHLCLHLCLFYFCWYCFFKLLIFISGILSNAFPSPVVHVIFIILVSKARNVFMILN